MQGAVLGFYCSRRNTPFNSLFEMHDVGETTRKWLAGETFNSLFEMPVYAVDNLEAVLCAFQFSI